MIEFSGTFITISLSSLQSINRAHNQWRSKTRSIPYWTTSVFSSTVTDLVLIYESVAPSVSVVRWLALHSWTPNFWILLRLNDWTPWRKNSLNWTLFRNSEQTVERPPPPTVHLLLRAHSLARIRVFLTSRCLAMDYSGIQESCQDINWCKKGKVAPEFN
jgi:hypothetical protein